MRRPRRNRFLRQSVDVIQREADLSSGAASANGSSNRGQPTLEGQQRSVRRNSGECGPAN